MEDFEVQLVGPPVFVGQGLLARMLRLLLGRHVRCSANQGEAKRDKGQESAEFHGESGVVGIFRALGFCPERC